MKFRIRQLRPDETDFERLFGIYVLTPLLIVLAWLNHADRLWPCLFKKYTGFPCPACEAAHAWNALLAGRIAEALVMQPLMTVAEIGAVLFVIYSWVIVPLKTPRLRVEGVRPISIAAWIVALVILNWFYILWRAT